MKKQLLHLVAIAMVAIFVTSCASLTGFEEGKVLGEGNKEAIVSGNYTTVPDLLSDDFDTLAINDNIGFPNIEFSYKYGITDKLDVGGRISTTLTTSAYAKYQLVGDNSSKFALAGGLEIGTFAGIAYTVGIPVYASIYPTESITININPRFLYQTAAGAGGDGITYLGGNAGLLFGKKHKFGLDVGFYSLGGSVSSGTNLLTFGVGGKFRFGDFGSSGSSSGRKRR